jgi:hypothetical protein
MDSWVRQDLNFRPDPSDHPRRMCSPGSPNPGLPCELLSTLVAPAKSTTKNYATNSVEWFPCRAYQNANRRRLGRNQSGRRPSAPFLRTQRAGRANVRLQREHEKLDRPLRSRRRYRIRKRTRSRPRQKFPEKNRECGIAADKVERVSFAIRFFLEQNRKNSDLYSRQEAQPHSSFYGCAVRVFNNCQVISMDRGT